MPSFGALPAIVEPSHHRKEYSRCGHWGDASVPFSVPLIACTSKSWGISAFYFIFIDIDADNVLDWKVYVPHMYESHWGHVETLGRLQKKYKKILEHLLILTDVNESDDDNYLTWYPWIVCNPLNMLGFTKMGECRTLENSREQNMVPIMTTPRKGVLPDLIGGSLDILQTFDERYHSLKKEHILPSNMQDNAAPTIKFSVAYEHIRNCKDRKVTIQQIIRSHEQKEEEIMLEKKRQQARGDEELDRKRSLADVDLYTEPEDYNDVVCKDVIRTKDDIRTTYGTIKASWSTKSVACFFNNINFLLREKCWNFPWLARVVSRRTVCDSLAYCCEFETATRLVWVTDTNLKKLSYLIPYMDIEFPDPIMENNVIKCANNYLKVICAFDNGEGRAASPDALTDRERKELASNEKSASLGTEYEEFLLSEASAAVVNEPSFLTKSYEEITSAIKKKANFIRNTSKVE